MLNCPGCEIRVTGQDLLAGVCSHCGKNLAGKGNSSFIVPTSKPLPASDSDNLTPGDAQNSDHAEAKLQIRIADGEAPSDEDSSEFESNPAQVRDTGVLDDSSEPEESGNVITSMSDSVSSPEHDEPIQTASEDVEQVSGELVQRTVDITQTYHDAESHQTLVIKTRMLVQSNDGATESVEGDKPEYELIGVLGVGGMGIVYDARQTSIDRNVALKMIKGDVVENDKRNAKFLAEAVVTGDLDHPNIVPIYDVGTNSDGQLFYSMKKVQGTPWMDVIKSKSLAENLEILMRTADAVGFAHARGIVHRDLKPENIMLGEFGEVLLMDWGLAYPLKGYRKSKNVATSKSMGGTPAYMAPEMATGPIEKIGTTSDVYLLGAILYEIVTGKPPHPGKTAMKCLVAAARNQIIPTEKTGELVDIAIKAMATEPQDRYQNVKDFQSAIRDYQSHAESILLTVRADDDLNEARQSEDYQKYSRSLFGFQEAFQLWSGNKRAEAGISDTKLAYAESAKRKGDYDLGLSLLDESEPGHANLRRDLNKARKERVTRQKRIYFLKRAAIGLTVAVLVVVTGAALWIRKEQQKAIAEAIRATNAEKIALSEKARAEVAADKEKTAKLAAIAAEQEAISQKLKAEESQKLEEKAKNAAIAAEEQAIVEQKKAETAKQKEEYEAYISKIGLAASQIDKNAFDVAREVLVTCKPDLRHWEWGRLMHLCSQSTRVFDAHSPLEAIDMDLGGNRFAAGGWNGTATIWNRQTGQVLCSLKHGGEYVNAVAFSPDGRFLATGGNDSDGFIQIWDIEKAQRVRTIKGHADEVLSLAYSKDGKRLLSSSYDRTARLWDTATGREIRKFVGHTWWVWSAAFSTDEQRVITAGHDGTSIVWDVETDKRSPPFMGHRGPVFCAVFSPDGRRAVTAGYDRRILSWNPDDVKPFDIKHVIDGSAAPLTNTRVFEGHSDAIRSIKFSADGSLLLSASFDNTIRIWMYESNQLLKTFRGHGGRVKAATFEPDGRSVLSAAHDNTVREWSIADYEEIRTLRGRSLEGHSDAVLAATYSRDQSQIVTASRDRTARTWDAKTGEPGLTFAEGHSFLASSAIFFPDGRRLLTAAVDNTARIWDVTTGGQIQRLPRSGRSAAVALSHNANLIATGADDKSAQLWDATTGNRLKKFEGHLAEVTSVAFAPDDRTLATGDSKGHVKIWSIDDERVIAKVDVHTRRVSAIVFLSDGSRLLTASGDNTVGQWDIATGRELTDRILKHPDGLLTMQSIPGKNAIVTSCSDRMVRVWDVDEAAVKMEFGPFESEVFSISISTDGRRMLTANSQERTVRLWDLETGNEVQTQQPDGSLGAIVDLKRHGGQLWSTAFVPETEDVLTVGGSDVRLWDSKTGRPKLSFNQHGTVASARFSPDGELIVTSSWDNTAKIWNSKTGRVIRKLENGHSGFVNSAVFSPDGQFVLTASDDTSAKLWTVASGDVVRTFEGHQDRIRSASFSPNGEFIITTSNDKTARLWRTESGELIREFIGHDWAVVSADFSADGKWVVTGSEDTTARVWEVESGKTLLTLSGHTASITSVCFSPDMLRIVTGSQDQVAKLWDSKSGKEILTLSRHSEEVTSVAFSPDGRQVLTGSRDGTAVIWLSSDWNRRDDVALRNGTSQTDAPQKK